MKLYAVLLMLSLAVQVNVNPAAPLEKATVEGDVVSLQNGEPLARAEITLTKVTAPPERPEVDAEYAPPETVIVNSGLDGKFRFKDVAAGEYRIHVKRNGYVAQWYGQRGPNGQGTTVTLTDGQKLKDLTFRMRASSIVAGRIRDSEGDPAINVRVFLFKTGYDPSGWRTFETIASAFTDDRGEYRMFGITPGRYFLGVGGSGGRMPFEFYEFGPGEFGPGFTGSRQNIVGLRGQPTMYYPGTFDFALATPIEVLAGVERGGIDVGLMRTVLHTVRGTVVDGASDKPPRNISLSLYPRGDMRLGAPESRYSSRYSNGSFEFRDVMAGSYWLSAGQQRGEQEALPENLLSSVRTTSDLFELAFQSRASARIPVDVVTSDLDGLVLRLTPGFSIPVQVRVEGQALSSIEGISRMRIGLWPRMLEGEQGSQQRGPVDQNGFTRIENIPAGEYRVWIIGDVPQPELYLKEARLGGVDALDGFLQFDAPVSETLQVVLGSKAGTIEGSVTDAAGHTIPGLQVNLIPDRSRYRDELQKSARTDQNGHFTFRSLAPGAYKVFAWESIEPFSWFDPDVMAKYELLGTPVRVEEGSKENVQVRLIPAPQ